MLFCESWTYCLLTLNSWLFLSANLDQTRRSPERKIPAVFGSLPSLKGLFLGKWWKRTVLNLENSRFHFGIISWVKKSNSWKTNLQATMDSLGAYPNHLESWDRYKYYGLVRLIYVQHNKIKWHTLIPTFWIENNRVSGKIPTILGNLRALHELNLSKTTNRQWMHGVFCGLTLHIWYFIASGNNTLTGVIPLEFGKLKNLRRINLGKFPYCCYSQHGILYVYICRMIWK